MTALTPRLQTAFEKTKTVCFGRFMVDVPESAIVAWGHASMVLGIDFYQGGANAVMVEAMEFSKELKATEALYHDNISMFITEEDSIQPPGRIITGLESFDALNGLQIKGYYRWGEDGLVVSARPLRDDLAETVAEIKSITQRLRSREEHEIPMEPGNCLEYSFLRDKAVADAEPPIEHVRIGFRLKEFPDTHLSIYIAPPNPYNAESDTLEWQLEKLEKEHTAESSNHPLLKTKYFRRGPRQIHEWSNGWEALSRSPDQPGVHGIHDFVMDVKGVLKDVYKPYADIKMQTGVADNAAGAVKPSLTDDEAVAVWDRITSSIRVRPTTAPGTTAAGSPTPREPLGAVAATGKRCPQDGWWEPTETGLPQGGRREKFKAGQTLPPLVMAGPQSWWQKIRGERPAFSAATVWKLVAYDDKAAATNAAATKSPEREN
ncbi:hypothetical protein GCM10007388_09300 [Pseudoduganella plicata]|nr:hypothetical protein GCM10007388_09300 [Pseudoduganella plicata]